MHFCSRVTTQQRFLRFKGARHRHRVEVSEKFRSFIRSQFISSEVIPFRKPDARSSNVRRMLWRVRPEFQADRVQAWKQPRGISVVTPSLNYTHSEVFFNVSNIGQTADPRSEKVWSGASEMLWSGLRNSSDSVFLDLALCRWNPDPFALRRGWEKEDDPGGARSEQVIGSAKSDDSAG